MKATTKYDKEKQTLTISIPGMIILPEIVCDAATGKVTKGKSPNAHMITVRKSSPKRTSRKKSAGRPKNK